MALNLVRGLPEDFAADASIIANWYDKASDRIRNPVQLKGFNETPRKILTFLNEQMIAIDVPNGDIELFINRARDHVSKNPELNKDSDNLTAFLEFYLKSGDYYLVFSRGHSILDLFLGKPIEFGKENDLSFAVFSQHFIPYQELLASINFSKFFYLGLNDDKMYQRFRRPSKTIWKDLLNTEESKNITPYVFLKHLNDIFDKKTIANLELALAKAEETADSKPSQFRYSLAKELVFIKIVLLMIEHLQKYIDLQYYVSADSSVLDLVDPLVDMLLNYHKLFSFISSEILIESYGSAYNYINSFQSKENKLKALELFFKKLEKCKEQTKEREYKMQAEFWDDFDLYSIDPEFERTNDFRSYKYRSDFPMGIRKIGIFTIDNTIISEIDTILAEKSFPFSYLIRYFKNPSTSIKLNYFFNQIKSTLGYNLNNSNSESREKFKKVIKEEEDKLYRYDNPKPYEDEFEQRWAEEVPKPLLAKDLTPDKEGTSIDKFVSALSRFRGFPFVDKYLKDIEAIKTNPKVNKAADYMAIMERYVNDRSRLLTLRGLLDTTIKTVNTDIIIDATFKIPSELYVCSSLLNQNKLLQILPYGKTPAAPTTAKDSDSDDITIQIKPYDLHVYDGMPCYFNSDKVYYEEAEYDGTESNGTKFEGIKTLFIEVDTAFVCCVKLDGTEILIHEISLNTNTANKINSVKPSNASDFKGADRTFRFAKQGNTMFILASKQGEVPVLWKYDYKGTTAPEKFIEFPNLKTFGQFTLLATPYFLFVSYYDGNSSKILHVYAEGNEKRVHKVAEVGNTFQTKRMIFDEVNKLLILIDGRSNQPKFIRLDEIAIHPPLIQPKLPAVTQDKATNQTAITKWWNEMSADSLFTDKLKEYKRAMKMVQSCIGSIYTETLVILDTMNENNEFTEQMFKNIYLPMLIEWYTYCDPTKVQQVVGGSQRGGGMSALVNNFINISSKDNRMKENLRLIANNPHRDYRGLVQHYQDTLPELHIERALRR